MRRPRSATRPRDEWGTPRGVPAGNAVRLAPGFEGELPRRARRKQTDGARAKRSLATACDRAREILKAVSEGNVEKLRATTPADLVGLYAILHAHVYGVEPIELGEGKTFLAATSAAAKLMRDLDNPITAIDLVRWTWRRESRREQRRRENGDQAEAFRFGWRLQFVARAIVADYRIAQVRARGAR